MTIIELLKGVSKPGAVYLHPEDWERLEERAKHYGTPYVEFLPRVRVSENVLPLSKIKNPLLFYSVTGSYFIVEKAEVEGPAEFALTNATDLLPGLEESPQVGASLADRFAAHGYKLEGPSENPEFTWPSKQLETEIRECPMCGAQYLLVGKDAAGNELLITHPQFGSSGPPVAFLANGLGPSASQPPADD